MNSSAWRPSLRSRITAWSFVPTTIILLAITTLVFYAYQSLAMDLVVGRNRELTSRTAEQLAADLSSYTDLLSELAQTADITSGSAVRQSAALQLAASRLVAFDGGLALLDQAGRVISIRPERREWLGQDWSGQPFVQAIAQTQRPVFTDLLPGKLTVAGIAVPVHGGGDAWHGSLVGLFALSADADSALASEIAKLRIGEMGNAFLVDSAGRVLYHSSGARLGDSLQGLPVVRRVVAGQAGYLATVDAEGNRVLAAYAPVPGTPWGLVSEQPWSDLITPIQGYAQSLLLLLALGVIVPPLVVTFGAKRITDPIRQLITAAQEIAGGQFGQKIVVNSGDELEELATTFNRMADELQESYAALREREERLSLVIDGTNDGIWDWDLRTNATYFSPRWKAMLGYADDEIVNSFDSWEALLHPEDREHARAELRAYFAGHNPVYRLEHRLRQKDGSYRWILARGTVLRDADGKPYRMAGSHSDIHARKEAEAALRQSERLLEQRVAERTHELAVLNEIGAVVSRSLDLTEIMTAALTKAMEVMHLEVGVAYSLEGAGHGEDRALALIAQQGLSQAFPQNLGTRSGPGAALRLASAAQQPTVWPVAEIPAANVRHALAAEGVQQVISVPLFAKGQFVGAMVLGTRHARALRPEELSLLASIGQQIAVAVENAHLYESAEQSAAIAERHRLSRELHDSVTQSLYSVTMYAEAAARVLAAGDAAVAGEHLRELRDTAQEALREMRLLIFELRPLALDKVGLAAALQARLDSVEVRGGMKTELHVEGAPPPGQVSTSLEEELYHIAQEALNNVLKHARARNVRVELLFSAAGAQLAICDDGAGFVPGPAQSGGGLGLASLRERADKIGGCLTIRSAPGQGTEVRIVVPAVTVTARPSCRPEAPVAADEGEV